jgi:CheY-like chemotaxis protein
MGGSITVESEYGRGSVFRLQLPQGIVDAAPMGREMAEDLRKFRFLEDRNRSRGNTLVRSHMPYGKVLVVDDLETNLDVMTGLLMSYGLRVDTVLSGPEAVERVRAEEVRYDLVFMDHMMPGMDGIEATGIIRKEIDSEYALSVPIIALTANALEGNREMFLNSGFTDFISKPIDIKHLDMVLNRWIRDKQSEAVLQDAEQQNLERAEGGGKFKDGELDAEGRWLLGHPVEGVDFTAALRLYGDSGAVCLPVLRSFVAHTPLLLEKMAKNLETSPDDYLIEIHGLKGNCKAIGAAEAGTLAGELESGMKEGNTAMVKARHGELEEKVRSLTERLKQALDGWESDRPAGEKELREEPDKELLERLSEVTATFNSHEVEEILGNLEQYRYERGEELIRWLRGRAENFDYGAMHKRLENLPGAFR